MIYFLQDSGLNLIKIGYTASEPLERAKQLQTGSPFQLQLLFSMPGEPADEKELHKRFANSRERGEWFRPTPEVLSFVVEKSHSSGRMASVNLRECTCHKSPVEINHIWPLKIYLAGKISKQDWRNDIVSGLDTAITAYCPLKTDDPIQTSEVQWTDAYSYHEFRWPVLSKSIFGLHSYVGPFFVNCKTDYLCTDCMRHGEGFCSGGHGCHCADEPCEKKCYFGDDSHGVGAQGIVVPEEGDKHCGMAFISETVQKLCLESIKLADVVFCWIDSLDCYGTITEIGYATSLGKRIAICGPRYFRDMWFAYQSAEFVEFHRTSPKECLAQYLAEKEAVLDTAATL